VRFARRRWVVGGAAAALAVAALLVIMIVPRGWSSRWSSGGAAGRFEQLVAALGDARPSEGRLTGGFRYAVPASPSRSVTDRADNLPLLAAAAEIEQAVEVNPSAASRHAWGVALVLLGRHDEAIAVLEQLAGEDGANSRYQADLAAAYIARAPTAGHADDWARALAAAERALAVAPPLAEAHFNRALALAALNRPGEARTAWAAYLTVDATSEWANEARARLRDLETAAR
jgi:tetratricopeptide (TPR) repeat protein